MLIEPLKLEKDGDGNAVDINAVNKEHAVTTCETGKYYLTR